MFAALYDGLSFLKAYDEGRIQGVRFDFETTGPYYDPGYGTNWWSYYFEPVELGIVNESAVKINKDIHNFGGRHPDFIGFSRREVNRLIKKYYHLRPEIEKKIAQFAEEHFAGVYLIGVHYRGTDKVSEAPRTSYVQVFKELKHQISLLPKDKNYKIFVATDEAKFLEAIQQEFPSKIEWVKDAKRSTDGAPVHLSNVDRSGYKLGEEAIMDCLLLSRADLLIRTSSNLSKWSTYFNPDMPVIELSQLY